MSTYPAQPTASSPALADPIPYATPAPRSAARGWAGTAVVLGGLGLMVIAGCFLMGALSIVSPNLTLATTAAPADLTNPQLVLLTILYACALACFVGGGVMLTLGTRALLRLTTG